MIKHLPEIISLILIFLAKSPPIDFLVRDSHGRRVGSIYQNGAYVEEVSEMPGAVYTKRGAARLAYLPISDFDLTFYVYGTGSSEFEINTLLIDKGSAKQGKTSGHIEKSEEKMFTVKASENNISIDEIRSLQWYLTRIIPPALAVSVIGLAAKIMRKRARGREPRTIAGERRSLR